MHLYCHNFHQVVPLSIWMHNILSAGVMVIWRALIETISHVTSQPLSSAYRCYYCTPILPTGPVNLPPLSLPLPGWGQLRSVHIHAEPPSVGPPTIPPSGPPTQLAPMSYSHLYPAAVLLPALPSGPGLCKVCFTGLIRRVPYRLLSCIHPVPTIHVESPIIGSQPSSDLDIYLSRGFSWSNGGAARGTA